MSKTGECWQQKHVHEDGMRLPLWLIRKWLHTQKSQQKWWTPETELETGKKKKNPLNCLALSFRTITSTEWLSKTLVRCHTVNIYLSVGYRETDHRCLWNGASHCQPYKGGEILIHGQRVHTQFFEAIAKQVRIFTVYSTEKTRWQTTSLDDVLVALVNR